VSRHPGVPQGWCTSVWSVSGASLSRKAGHTGNVSGITRHPVRFMPHRVESFKVGGGFWNDLNTEKSICGDFCGGFHHKSKSPQILSPQVFVGMIFFSSPHIYHRLYM